MICSLAKPPYSSCSARGVSQWKRVLPLASSTERSWGPSHDGLNALAPGEVYQIVVEVDARLIDRRIGLAEWQDAGPEQAERVDVRAQRSDPGEIYTQLPT